MNHVIKSAWAQGFQICFDHQKILTYRSQKLWSSKGCLFLWRHGVDCAGRLFTAPCGPDIAGILFTCTRFQVWIDIFITFARVFRFALSGFCKIFTYHIRKWFEFRVSSFVNVCFWWITVWSWYQTHLCLDGRVWGIAYRCQFTPKTCCECIISSLYARGEGAAVGHAGAHTKASWSTPNFR